MSDLRSGVMKGMREPDADIGDLIAELQKYHNDHACGPWTEVSPFSRAAAALTAAKAMADAVESAIGPYPATVYPNLRNALSAFRAAGG